MNNNILYKTCKNTSIYNNKRLNLIRLHKVHAPDNLSNVLQVYIAILPIHNNTYKLRNGV